MYKRFFAFGCSFTKWKWPTWADVLANQLQIEYHNFAQPAVGNEYIFHKIVETNVKYKFHEKDLIIVCWTNFAREDRYKNNHWIPSGNMYRYAVYDKKWVDKWFDLKGSLIKTSSFVASTTHLLEHTGCSYLYSSMMPMTLLNTQDPLYKDIDVNDVLDTYKEYFKNFLPSMVEYLYNSLPYCVNPDPQEANDNHPSEEQHQLYVKNVIYPALENLHV